MTAFPLDDYPGMNRFVRDWLHGDERFLKRGPLPRVSRDPLPASRSETRAAVASALIESNKRWGSFVREDVEREECLRRPRAFQLFDACCLP